MSGRFKDPLLWNRVDSRRLTKRVPTEDGHGHTYIEDGREQYQYEVNIDYRDVQAMARRAADSKGGQCIAGPV